jgi:IclR family acetate operon transcriptional repressor
MTPKTATRDPGAAPDNGHRTANRVLDILELLARTPAGCALKDLSRELDAPKSSLLSLLQTLDRRGYVTQGSGGIYRLGTRALELSGALGGDQDLRDVAHVEIRALAGKTGESAILATLTSDHRAVIYIDKVESLHRIRATARVGETRPLHSTSSGRLLLAHLPASEREALIDQLELTRFTAQTITSRSRLRREMTRILGEGICINVDQSLQGHCAMAAPIRDRRGEVVAACVLSAPSERVRDAIATLAEQVKASALAISLRLGHRPGRDGSAVSKPDAGEGAEQGRSITLSN